MPIDGLFHSLAEDQGERAICILLSGSGSDGTLGLRSVKEHGGMVMAQSPESAKHDAMLRSAIGTGIVDHVLPPEADAGAARRVRAATCAELHQKNVKDSLSEELGDQLARICALLRRKTGHDFSRYKTTTLVRRIQRRMQVQQLASVAAYVERLRQDPEEAEQLFRDLLIGVTQLLPRPDRLRRARARGDPAALRPGRRRRTDPRLGAGLRHRRGGLLGRDPAARGAAAPRARARACRSSPATSTTRRSSSRARGATRRASPST